MTTKEAFNLKALFPRHDEEDSSWYRIVGDETILCVFTVFLFIIGLVGNGNIIWLLGFRIKRKPTAIYILNLAVADLGTLIFLLPLSIIVTLLSFNEYLDFPAVLTKLLMSLFVWIYCIHHLFLAAISTDRWVSVLFPNWYRCHWPSVLSTIVCAFIWVLSLALSGVPIILLSMDLIPGYAYRVIWGHIAVIFICLLLVIFSTLTQLFKVCLKSQPCQCGNLSKVILLILLSALLWTVLMYVSVIMFPQSALSYCGLWTSLKGSINPLIYFLAGRRNGGQFQQRMKVILQRVFKEERNARMEWAPRTHTSNL